MSARAAIADACAEIAAEIAADGRAGPFAMSAGSYFAENGAAPDIAAFLFAQARKRQIDTDLVQAACLLLENAPGNRANRQPDR